MAVSSWTALAAGTDYVAQSGVTLTLTTDGNNATIRIQNVNAAATTMDIQLRGIPVVRNSAVEIITEDQDSIDEVGQPIPYPFETPWISDPATVAVIHGILLRIYAQPAERLTLTWEVGSDRAKAASLDLSERVEVMRRNEATEFFHRVNPAPADPRLPLHHHDAFRRRGCTARCSSSGSVVMGKGYCRDDHDSTAHISTAAAQVWRASYLNDNANDPINDLAGKNGKRDREASLEVLSGPDGNRYVRLPTGTTAQRPNESRAGLPAVQHDGGGTGVLERHGMAAAEP